MKRISLLVLGVGFILNVQAQEERKFLVKDKAPAYWLPFQLSQTRLLEGSPFYHAMKLDQKYLLGMDVNRMLNGYRRRAGLPELGEFPGSNQPKNTRAGGMPHYISAISLMYAQTGDTAYKSRANYLMDKLKEAKDIINKNNPGNYILGKRDADKALHEVLKGKITLEGPDETGYPWGGMGNFWYVVHKELAAYRDCYLNCDNLTAFALYKEEGERIADFALKANPDLFDDMLDIEHGGMNEVFADLYALTGDERYMLVSKKFNHQKVILNTALGNDVLYGRHVNMQVPTFVGTARQYQLDGNDISKKATFNFLEEMYGNYNNVIGGSGRYERYIRPGEESKSLGFTADETCATYNMLKTAKIAFETSGDMKHMDFYERALYNHILASQDPVSGGVTYYTSLMPGGFKSYSDGYNLQWIWCCVGTGMENHAKYGEAVYFHNEKGLLVNLFIPSSLNWEEKDLKLKLLTKFPEEDFITLKVVENKSFKGNLMFRYPAWAGTAKVWLNDKPINYIGKPGALLEIKEILKKGDEVRVQFPQSFWLQPAKDEPDLVALMRGPLVMAATLGNEKMPGSDLVSHVMKYNNWKPVKDDIPIIEANKTDLDGWIKPVPGQPLAFRTQNAGFLNGESKEVDFLPYYKVHHQRYSVYLKMFSPQEWAERKQVVSDEINPSNLKDEQAHQLKSFQSDTSSVKDSRHFWENNQIGRIAKSGGWFSYHVKANPAADKQYLTVTYWGSADEGNSLTILIDGKSFITEDLGEKHPITYYEKTYQLPDACKGGKNMDISFKAPAGSSGGAIYGLKISSESEKFKDYLFY